MPPVPKLQKFKVVASWDADACVYVSLSDIPGLVVEAETLDEFVQLVQTLAPEMLADNVPGSDRAFELTVETRLSVVPVAA